MVPSLNQPKIHGKKGVTNDGDLYKKNAREKYSVNHIFMSLKEWNLHTQMFLNSSEFIDFKFLIKGSKTANYFLNFVNHLFVVFGENTK